MEKALQKKKQKSEKPVPVAFFNATGDPDISEYIVAKLGIEPNASGSRRRWHFLRMMARYIYQQKTIGFNDFFRWTTAHCQCMKMRTLREDYLDTLEKIGLVKFDLNTGRIEWKGEDSG